MPQISNIAKFYEGKRTGWKKPWGELWDGTKIFIVDGPYVRANYYVDFVEGGHGYVYSWMPKSEVWIEEMEDGIDQSMNLLHELYEYSLMRYVPSKKDYDKAHECSANVESLVREAMAGKTKLKAKQ